ncbi:MAG: alpha/beta hydrolase [Rhizobiaceae bacterium]
MTGFVDFDSAGVAWRERAGGGPVLVALHGIGSQARSFDLLAARLPGWRVIAWEMPGYGPSAPLAAEWPVAADYAAALDRMTTMQGLSRFHLVGHSLGTLIAASFARHFPGRVQSVTLASCAQGGGIAPGSGLPADQAERIAELEHNGPAAFAATRASRLVYEPEANPALVAAVEAGMSRVRLPGYRQAVRMLAAGNLAADCARLAIPTAVTVGEADIVTPPPQSRRAHAALPDAVRGDFTLVAGAGHALHLQAPAALAAVIETRARTAATVREEC